MNEEQIQRAAADVIRQIVRDGVAQIWWQDAIPTDNMAEFHAILNALRSANIMVFWNERV